MSCQYVFEITSDTPYNPSNLHWYSGLKFMCNSKDRVGKTEIKSSEFHGLDLKRKKKNSIIGKNVNFFLYFTLVSVRVKFVSFSPFSPAYPHILPLKTLSILAWHPRLTPGPLGWAFSESQVPCVLLYMRRGADRPLGLIRQGAQPLHEVHGQLKISCHLINEERSPEEGNSH